VARICRTRIQTLDKALMEPRIKLMWGYFFTRMVFGLFFKSIDE